MANKETVISWLEGLAEDDWRECYSDSEVQETARQALNLIDALLKEQQEQMDKLIEESASNAEMAEGMNELLKEQETELCDRCGRRRLKSSRIAECR